jgi:hypothetical protein
MKGAFIMKLRDVAETFLHAAGEAPAVTRLVTNAALLVTVQAAGAGTWAALRGRGRATKRAIPPPPRARDQRRPIVAAFAGGAALLALWAALALLARVRRMPILTAYPLYGYALLRYLPVVTRTDHPTRSRQPMALEIVPPPASPVIQRRTIESEAAQATELALAIAR